MIAKLFDVKYHTLDLSLYLFPQALILACGMAAILCALIASGTASGGDLVMASGLIAQLWAPLQFLGWFYRCVCGAGLRVCLWNLRW